MAVIHNLYEQTATPTCTTQADWGYNGLSKQGSPDKKGFLA
jgi:hypothetical protein